MAASMAVSMAGKKVGMKVVSMAGLKGVLMVGRMAAWKASMKAESSVVRMAEMTVGKRDLRRVGSMAGLMVQQLVCSKVV